uniref:Ion transport domain-containing protein n=1 Tax=Laticauda laticaudata TaxID=8630 RepID=A0A8C5RJB9_LATLA
PAARAFSGRRRRSRPGRAGSVGRRGSGDGRKAPGRGVRWGRRRRRRRLLRGALRGGPAEGSGKEASSVPAAPSGSSLSRHPRPAASPPRQVLPPRAGHGGSLGPSHPERGRAPLPHLPRQPGRLPGHQAGRAGRARGGGPLRLRRPRRRVLLRPERRPPLRAGLCSPIPVFNVALIAILCTKGGQREDFLEHRNFTHTHPPLLVSLCPQRVSLLHLELFFILCFMCEFATRLVSCPDKKRFFRKALNVVDFLALFPVCLDLFFSQRGRRLETLPCWLNLFRVVYVLKLLKVFQLLETPRMLRVFRYMLRSILKDIAILLWVFLFEILFFGSLMLFADLIEDHPDKLLHDIFSSFWLAVITLTTIGYGDMYPFQPAGRVIGACAVLCGLLTIIVPIPIFFIKFKHHYTSAVIKEKRKREEKATASSEV